MDRSRNEVSIENQLPLNWISNTNPAAGSAGVPACCLSLTLDRTSIRRSRRGRLRSQHERLLRCDDNIKDEVDVFNTNSAAGKAGVPACRLSLTLDRTSIRRSRRGRLRSQHERLLRCHDVTKGEVGCWCTSNEEVHHNRKSAAYYAHSIN